VNFGEHLLSEGVASASAHEEGGASCAPSDLAPVLWAFWAGFSNDREQG
jgi:hypothetical protein